jgi:hypothetical protein
MSLAGDIRTPTMASEAYIAVPVEKVNVSMPLVKRGEWDNMRVADQ